MDVATIHLENVEYCAEIEYSPKLSVELPDGDFSLTWYNNGFEISNNFGKT